MRASVASLKKNTYSARRASQNVGIEIPASETTLTT